MNPSSSSPGGQKADLVSLVKAEVCAGWSLVEALRLLLPFLGPRGGRVLGWRPGLIFRVSNTHTSEPTVLTSLWPQPPAFRDLPSNNLQQPPASTPITLMAPESSLSVGGGTVSALGSEHDRRWGHYSAQEVRPILCPRVPTCPLNRLTACASRLGHRIPPAADPCHSGKPWLLN